MTKRERLARMAGLVVTILPLEPAQVPAPRAATPPEVVTTVCVTDTVQGFGARLEPDVALTKARLELAAPGS
ncbi:MAG TPA: hypothetical protein VLA36_13465 [Longimicrobiales bacterium]|nr:hypothetical protein [Longimicrobiales bacterium]